MKIIPVLDIKDGIVVHGKGGQREEYQPIQSQIVTDNSAVPYDVITSFVNQLGTDTFYIADLDALEEQGDNLQLISDLIQSFPNLSYMLDAGVKTLDSVHRIMNTGVEKVIIATETLEDMNYIKELANQGTENFILSIDFMNGDFLTNLANYTPKKFIEEAKQLDFKDFILLDVGQVGTGKGITNRLLKLARKFSDLNFITGGGIKDYNDAQQVKKEGFWGLLVATALHNQKIGRKEVNKLRN